MGCTFEIGIIVFPKHVLSEPSRQTGLADACIRTHGMSDTRFPFAHSSFGLTITTDDDELVCSIRPGLGIIRLAGNPETRTIVWLGSQEVKAHLGHFYPQANNKSLTARRAREGLGGEKQA